MSDASAEKPPLKLFLVAGEHSGDALGGKLIAGLRALSPRPLELTGVAGDQMAAQGCSTLFPLSDIAVMSPLDILRRLPFLLRRIDETVKAGLAFEPDALVIVDSPEFTHLVARRMRRKRPDLPVVDYVSPTVWGWRPWRARKMRRYVDHVLALLPFEPAAHERLGGPPCTYVGHPLSERLDWIASRDPGPLASRLGLDLGKPVLLVLPGSRSSEVKRLMHPFGETLRLLQQQTEPFETILPVLNSVRPLVERELDSWPVRPHLISGDDDKFAAFGMARAALAASGTVTLELAVAGTPMVVAYIVDPLALSLRFLLRVHSVVLPNLILERNVVPERLQEECTPEKLAAALLPLLQDGSPERAAQVEGLAEVRRRVQHTGESPSEMAARIVLQHAGVKPLAR